MAAMALVSDHDLFPSGGVTAVRRGSGGRHGAQCRASCYLADSDLAMPVLAPITMRLPAVDIDHVARAAHTRPRVLSVKAVGPNPILISFSVAARVGLLPRRAFRHIAPPRRRRLPPRHVHRRARRACHVASLDAVRVVEVTVVPEDALADLRQPISGEAARQPTFLALAFVRRGR